MSGSAMFIGNITAGTHQSTDYALIINPDGATILTGPVKSLDTPHSMMDFLIFLIVDTVCKC